MKLLGIDMMINDEIFEYFHKWLHINNDKQNGRQEVDHNFHNSPLHLRFEGPTNYSVLSEALAEYIWTDYTMQDIAGRFGLSKDQLMHYMRYLRAQAKFKIALEHIKLKRRNRKRTAKTIEKVRAIVEQQKHKPFAIKSVLDDFNDSLDFDRKISLSTWRRILVEDLRFSYKIWSKISSKTLTPEHVRTYFESAAFQIKMQMEDIEIIFFDGFSLDTRKLKLYHWSRRGSPACLTFDDDQFNMSFIAGLSSRKVYGIVGVNDAANSSVIINYLTNMLESRNKDPDLKAVSFILSMDNAAVHVSDSVQNFLRQSNLRAVTIASYWHSLNPTEKLIALIKSLVHKQLKRRK